MNDAQSDAPIDEDLAALRSYCPDYDVDRGAARLALATAALTVGAYSAGLGASSATGIGKSALWNAVVKAVGVLLSAGSVTLVALAPHLPEGEPDDTFTTTTVCVAALSPVETNVVPPEAPETSLTETHPIAASPLSETAATQSPNVAAEAGPPKNAAFDRDLAALKRARALASTNPSLVLERPSPAGRFALEHEILAIRALVATNRREEARTRIDRFLVAHPDSPFGDALRALKAAAQSRSSAEASIVE